MQSNIVFASLVTSILNCMPSWFLLWRFELLYVAFIWLAFGFSLVSLRHRSVGCPAITTTSITFPIGPMCGAERVNDQTRQRIVEITKRSTSSSNSCNINKSPQSESKITPAVILSTWAAPTLLVVESNVAICNSSATTTNSITTSWYI